MSTRRHGSRQLICLGHVLGFIIRSLRADASYRVDRCEKSTDACDSSDKRCARELHLRELCSARQCSAVATLLMQFN